jgi:glyoxylase-like metal-dependent hydrolase (beta-lactamase superfamily II)
MSRTSTLAIGDLEITSVWDGTLEASLSSILRLDPDEAARLVAAEQAASGTNPLILPVRAFLVRGPGYLALVDTGSGDTKGPTMGHLPASLAALGVVPSAITHVLMTHVHMDHIGGLIDASGQAAFPRAALLLHAEEARYFLDTPDEAVDVRSRRHLPFQRRAIAACGDRVRRVVDGEGLPGLVARLAPGHTPGHTCWEAEAGDEKAAIFGDAIHLGAVQLARPDSAMIYDVDAERAARTRSDMLGRLAREGTMVAGAHLPASGLGRIEPADQGYRFVPA